MVHKATAPFWTALLGAGLLLGGVAAVAAAAGSGLPVYIHVLDLEGGGTRFLAEGDRPAWSPDGRKIAFHRDGDIYVIEVDGFGETWLAEGTDPAWSPDGSQILFVDHEGIAIMDADGWRVAMIVRHDFLDLWHDLGGWTPYEDGRLRRPAWSPDGEHIAFEHPGAGSGEIPRQIYFVPAEPFVLVGNAQEFRLTSPSDSRSVETTPAWSPDGSEVAFWSSSYGIAATSGLSLPQSIYRGDDGEHVLAAGARPTWAPDGAALAFSVETALPYQAHVWAIDRDGSSLRRLVRGFDPAWSPEGGRIAFVSYSRSEPWAGPFPPLTRPAEVYERTSPFYRDRGMVNRYVLYEDGSFELQYVKSPRRFFGWTGAYSRAGSVITLEFGVTSVINDELWPWEATAELDGKRMFVEYNGIMGLSDFANGEYVLVSDSLGPPKGPFKVPDDPGEH